MNRTEILLDLESLRLLQHLIGGTWQCMGGRHMSDGTSDVSIFAVTDKGAITVSGFVEELSFEGDEDTYVGLRVQEGALGRQSATTSGHLYFQSSGQKVLDILIVRETVTQELKGSRTWTLVTDIGVVLVLGRGVLAISPVSHHTELLQARRADSLSDLDIDEPLSAWENDLETSYRREVALLPITSALRTSRH